MSIEEYAISVKEYKGYKMVKVSPKDILIADPNENWVMLVKLPKTYKEAKAIIDKLTNN